MTFKPQRDGRPLNERSVAVQMEAVFHQSIKDLLTKKQQGKVMGAFRQVLAQFGSEAIGRVVRGEVSDNNEYPDTKVVCVHDQADWDNFPDGTELFLSPVASPKSEGQQVYEAGLLAIVDTARKAYNEGYIEGVNLHDSVNPDVDTAWFASDACAACTKAVEMYAGRKL